MKRILHKKYLLLVILYCCAFKNNFTDTYAISTKRLISHFHGMTVSNSELSEIFQVSFERQLEVSASAHSKNNPPRK